MTEELDKFLDSVQPQPAAEAKPQPEKMSVARDATSTGSAERVVRCPVCNKPQPVEGYNVHLEQQHLSQEAYSKCSGCESQLQIEVFPAFLKPVEEGKAGEVLLVDDDASCFYHPKKKAAVPCDACGRFICSLCEIELGERHLCPTCFASGQEEGKESELQAQNKLHDTVALLFGLVPLIPCFWYFTFITAPIALYVTIRHWNAPCGITPRASRTRFVLGLMGGIAQIGITALMFFVYYSIFFSL